MVFPYVPWFSHGFPIFLMVFSGFSHGFPRVLSHSESCRLAQRWSTEKATREELLYVSSMAMENHHLSINVLFIAMSHTVLLDYKRVLTQPLEGYRNSSATPTRRTRNVCFCSLHSVKVGKPKNKQCPRPTFLWVVETIPKMLGLLLGCPPGYFFFICFTLQ